MPIRLTDNLMSRPLLPGGQSDGTENVTRVFGNQVETASALPSAPAGYGGVVNQAAGVEGMAMARAAEQVSSSLANTVQYFDNLRTAEEDSRAKKMFLEIDKREAEVRAKLDADPEYGKKSTADQQQIYEMERDTALDSINQTYNFSQPKIVKHVQDTMQAYRAKSSEQYLEKVVKPRVITNAKLNDAESDSMVIDKVTVEPTPENVASAVANITERYRSPAAYATYGSQNAMLLEKTAMVKLQQTILSSFQDTMKDTALANLKGGIIDTENLKQGEVALAVVEQKLRLKSLIDQLPPTVTEQEKMVIGQKGERYIDEYAKRSVIDHNNMVKEAEKQRLEGIQTTLDTWQVALSVQARNGQLSRKDAFAAFDKVVQSPQFQNDPTAIKKAYMAFDKVENEIVQFEREQRRLASESKTRESIAEIRKANGVAISGEALDQVWRKNGMLKGFFENGNRLHETHVKDIDDSGSVPTSVIGAIQNDLRSQDPEAQRRGIANIAVIKGYSAKSQQALYRSLPEGWSGVINRLENGQTPSEALSFLTRPRETPDIESKFKKMADDKNNKLVADKTMKDAGFDPNKMSIPMREDGYSQWRDAFSQAKGDVKLAQDLFKQSLSKNRTWGISKFSDKVEKYPLTNFTGSKDVATELIVDAMPELKGKDVVPVFGGLIITPEGKQTPTYDVYVRDENGLMTRANPRPFYVTAAEVAAKVEAKRDAEINSQVTRAEEIKANAEWWNGANDRLAAANAAKKAAYEAAKAKQGSK